MASLVSLPRELKDAIFHELAIEDWWRLSETCKALREIVLPTIYHDISLVWDYETESKQTHMAYLLRSILENPMLATYIANVKLSTQNGLML